uniref:U3 small nucleolar RNA-associated protein 15 homolog n=1 Tax=Ornithodoros turicata TaxID=34597 RepID=A0A2R5LMQ6_9ACAR
MAAFKGVQVLSLPRVGVKTTEDTLYWRKLSLPVTVKDVSAINHVDISRQEPYSFAVTCSTRVQIFNPVSREVTQRFSKFNKAACGAVFRSDGNLIAAGGEDGIVKLFDVKSKSLLRQFVGHRGPTQRCNFTPKGTQIVSFSDDSTVSLWDIPGQTRLLTIDAHDDYVRCGAVCKANPDIVLSGSYDHHAKIFDIRTSEAVVNVDHEAPVDSVLMFPNGGVFLTAGGNSIRVWDIVAGKLLAQIAQHHKTVTCLKLASKGQRLLSGSLDRHVKIYDVSNYQVVHTLDFPSPILSMDISPQDKVLVVGMTSGLFSVQRRKLDEPRVVSNRKRKRARSFSQAVSTDPGFIVERGDTVVPESKAQYLSKYNTYLRTFQVSKALTAALRQAKFMDQPQIAVSVMQDLIRRRALKPALAGRTGKDLVDVMQFVTRYAADTRFCRILLDVAMVMIEVYYPQITTCDETLRRFQILQKVVEQEVKNVQEMMELRGCVEMLMANSCSNVVAEDDRV